MSIRNVASTRYSVLHVFHIVAHAHDVFDAVALAHDVFDAVALAHDVFDIVALAQAPPHNVGTGRLIRRPLFLEDLSPEMSPTSVTSKRILTLCGSPEPSQQELQNTITHVAQLLAKMSDQMLQQLAFQPVPIPQPQRQPAQPSRPNSGPGAPLEASPEDFLRRLLVVLVLLLLVFLLAAPAEPEIRHLSSRLLPSPNPTPPPRGSCRARMRRLLLAAPAEPEIRRLLRLLVVPMSQLMAWGLPPPPPPAPPAKTSPPTSLLGMLRSLITFFSWSNDGSGRTPRHVYLSLEGPCPHLPSEPCSVICHKPPPYCVRLSRTPQPLLRLLETFRRTSSGGRLQDFLTEIDEFNDVAKIPDPVLISYVPPAFRRFSIADALGKPGNKRFAPSTTMTNITSSSNSTIPPPLPPKNKKNVDTPEEMMQKKGNRCKPLHQVWQEWP
ncbi:hypothetical protein BDZ91DRAFT_796808 [Kalaharituber pfeilii]|nr:hypothetical protein BDZ91DRAFT_796808 [Kalaharituber pfeilii]